MIKEVLDVLDVLEPTVEDTGLEIMGEGGGDTPLALVGCRKEKDAMSIFFLYLFLYLIKKYKYKKVN